MFHNAEIGKFVTIDIDIFVDDWIALGGYKAAVRRLQDLEKIIPRVKAFYRESSSKNVHILIESEKPLTLIDSLLIRAYFGDDQVRLRADMMRYFKSGKVDELGQYASGDLLQVGRCFDQKWKDGKFGQAGHWIPILFYP
jgi:hypothetical protein